MEELDLRLYDIYIYERKIRKKRRKIFGEWKYFFGGEGNGERYLQNENIFLVEKKMEENIWRRKILCG